VSLNYDPSAPDGDKPRGSGYVTRKDLMWVLLALPVIGLALTPLYLKMKADGEKKMCSYNVQGIAKAIQSYSALNDERLPPIYEEGENGNPTILKGAPINWMTVIETYLGPRTKTVCPSSKPEENSMYYSVKAKGPMPLSYGMFFPVAALPLYQISQPETMVLLTETITGGARDSYNPVPFTYSDGKVLRDDGFIIGFDNRPDGNFEHSTNSKSVTRLAFPNTKDGDFLKSGLEGRHNTGNHVIFANGGGGYLQASDAKVKMLGEDVTGRWRTR
jgi:hypothetical protein